MEDKWERVRQIVREECERIEASILLAINKHGEKKKLGFINGQWTGVTAEQVEAWRSAYGSCDVESELKKAAAWILSNPSQAPKSNYARFLNAWLGRQQNISAIRSIPTRSETMKRAGIFPCDYCEKTSVGIFAKRLHCDDHLQDAQEQKPILRRAK